MLKLHVDTHLLCVPVLNENNTSRISLAIPIGRKVMRVPKMCKPFYEISLECIQMQRMDSIILLVNYKFQNVMMYSTLF